MPLSLKSLFRAIRHHIDRLSWWALCALLLFHAAITWILLYTFGESELISQGNYLYYYIVTTSTVGYGDFSPTSDSGKWIVSLVQIPFGLAIFGAVLGKLGQTVTVLLRRNMTGDKNYSHYDDHIIIIGWHPERTKKIVEFILGDTRRVKRQILLAVSADIVHPMPENPMVDFAKLSSLTDLKELERIAISQASRIIIDGKDDNQTFTTGIRIANLVADDCHISAYFQDDSKVDMLRQHCKNIECCSSNTAQILVRSIQDPGASRVQEEMLSTLYGDTQFSLVIPDTDTAYDFGDLFYHFKQHHQATLIAIADNRIGLGMDLNPDNSAKLKGGQVLHYLSQKRILSKEVNWENISAMPT